MSIYSCLAILFTIWWVAPMATYERFVWPLPALILDTFAVFFWLGYMRGKQK